MNENPQADLQQHPAGMEILLAEAQAGAARAEAHLTAPEIAPIAVSVFRISAAAVAGFASIANNGRPVNLIYAV